MPSPGDVVPLFQTNLRGRRSG